ncbi:MAG: hypothetical protein ACLTEH_04770 [Clostridia bacterium]
MEEKEVSSVRKITGELIGGFILFSIVFGLINNFLQRIIATKIGSDNWVLQIIVGLIVAMGCIFFTYKCSTIVTFKKRSILYTDVSAVVKNILIYTVVICSLSIISTCMTTINRVENLEKEMNANSKVRLQEQWMQYVYSDSQIAQYRNEKQEIIEQTKTKYVVMCVVIEVAKVAIYFGMVPIEKKWIMKHAISDR